MVSLGARRSGGGPSRYLSIFDVFPAGGKCLCTSLKFTDNIRENHFKQLGLCIYGMSIYAKAGTDVPVPALPFPFTQCGRKKASASCPI